MAARVTRRGEARRRGVAARVLLADGDAAGLLAAWDGEPSVLLLDAVRTGAPPGTVHRVDARAAPLPGRLAGRLARGGASTHGLGAAAAVDLGRALGRLPASLVIYGVEPEAVEHGAPLSRSCARALGRCWRRWRRSCDARARRRASHRDARGGGGGGGELAALRLRLGPEGGFEAGALELSLLAAAAGTPAEGAAIEIRSAATGGVALESVVVPGPS